MPLVLRLCNIDLRGHPLATYFSSIQDTLSQPLIMSSALTLEKNKHEVGENLTEDRPAFFSSVRAEDIMNVYA